MRSLKVDDPLDAVAGNAINQIKALHNAVLQISRGKRDNLGMINHVSPQKHIL